MRKNWMNIIKTIAAATMLILTQQVSAACTQSDLTGVWYIQGTTADAELNAADSTVWCKVQFNSSGVVVAGNSSCNAREGSEKDFINIIGGKVTLNQFCRLVGRLRLVEGENLIIDNGYMDSQKSVISIAAYSTELPVQGVLFTGVKK